MRLLAHLVASDIRCHRWLLACWVAVVVAATVVDGIQPLMAERPSADNPLILLDGLLYLAWVLLRVIVVAQVIHAHPLVGSTAFWQTRPIPPLLLMRAKIVLLASALIALPVGAEAVLMAAWGVTFGDLVPVAAETALFATLWTALLAVPAVLTGTFSRFALACCGVVGALALYIAISITVSSLAPPIEPTVPLSTAIDYTGLFVFITALIVACASMAAAQYRWRRSGRSVAMVVAGVVAAAAAADWWAWPVLRAEPQLPPWTSGLSLSTNPDWTRTYSMTRNDDPSWKSTVGAVRVAGLPPGWSAETALLEASVEVDGQTLTSAPAFFQVPAATDGFSLDRHVVIQRLIAASKMIAEVPPSPPNSQLLVIPEAEFARYQPARGRYRSRHYVQLVHHVAEAAVPLRAGAAAAHGSYRLSVASVTMVYGSARVRVRESNATSRLDRRLPRTREFYVVNRRTGDAYGLGQGIPPVGLLPRMFSGVSLGTSPTDTGFSAHVLDLRFPPQWREAAVEPITQAWLADAELVVVTTAREGSVELPLVEPEFRLDEEGEPIPVRR
jgi:hypothetical protein